MIEDWIELQNLDVEHKMQQLCISLHKAFLQGPYPTALSTRWGDLCSCSNVSSFARMAVEDDLRTDCLPVIDQDDYATFRDIYLTRNVPVMFSAEVTAEWVSRRKWVQRQEEKQVSSIGYPEWDYLNRAHGHELVQVISCDDDEEELMGQSSILHIDDADMLPTTFGELLKVWRRGDGRTLYLKDWHLARQLACRENGGQQAIEAALHTVPKCWQDDWMNDYYSAETDDDFRFVVRARYAWKSV